MRIQSVLNASAKRKAIVCGYILEFHQKGE